MLYKQPVLGLVAFGVAFLSQWIGHSLVCLAHPPARARRPDVTESAAA